MQIGKHVRRQRIKLGFPLRHLATRTDLTTGCQSQIKYDQTARSIKSLQCTVTADDLPAPELTCQMLWFLIRIELLATQSMQKYDTIHTFL